MDKTEYIYGTQEHLEVHHVGLDVEHKLAGSWAFTVIVCSVYWLDGQMQILEPCSVRKTACSTLRVQLSLYTMLTHFVKFLNCLYKNVNSCLYKIWTVTVVSDEIQQARVAKYPQAHTTYHQGLVRRESHSCNCLFWWSFTWQYPLANKTLQAMPP